MSKPLLSVIVLAFNHEAFIAECLSSILSQKVDFPFEIIIANDASTDGTEEIVKRLAAQNDSIRDFHHDRNKGAAKNFEFAVKQSSGSIISLCEGDDFWHAKDKLQTHWDEFRSSEAISMVYSNYRKISAEGDVLEEGCLREQPETFELKDLIDKQGPSTHSMSFLKSVLPQSFPPDFFRVLNPDVFLMAWAISQGKSRYIDKVQASYRVHPGGIWSQKNELEKRLIRYATLLKVYQSLPDNTHREEEAIIPSLFHLLTKTRRANQKLYGEILAGLPQKLRWNYKLKTTYYRLKNG